MAGSMEILTKSAQETQKLGQRFAGGLKGGEVIALVGELGSGKTTFVQGLAHGLGIKERIISPTFILRRDYKGKTQNAKRKTLVHVDLYRLETKIDREFKNLGIEEGLAKGATVVVEWADKVRNSLPRSAIWITFKNLGGEKRKISINQ